MNSSQKSTTRIGDSQFKFQNRYKYFEPWTARHSSPVRRELCDPLMFTLMFTLCIKLLSQDCGFSCSGPFNWGCAAHDRMPPLTLSLSFSHHDQLHCPSQWRWWGENGRLIHKSEWIQLSAPVRVPCQADRRAHASVLETEGVSPIRVMISHAWLELCCIIRGAGDWLMGELCGVVESVTALLTLSSLRMAGAAQAAAAPASSCFF